MEIPGFEDLTEIGRGGFAVVYRASQPGFGRDVAIKVLNITVDRLDDRTTRRFETETTTTGQLSSHPHIITLHQAGVTDSHQPYLVMSYLSGGSLGDRMARNRLSWRAAVDITIKIAGALATAHRAGIAHRDVKPDNILIDDFGAPVLSDFGIASLTGADAATMTATGQVTGTVAYAPPESLDGQRPGRLADVFGLAATAFAMMAGHPPFGRPGDSSFTQVVARMMREDAPGLAAYGVPDPVADALARGLARDPRQRTPSVVELGQDLQDAQRRLGVPETAMVLPTGSEQGAEDERTLVLPGALLDQERDPDWTTGGSEPATDPAYASTKRAVAHQPTTPLAAEPARPYVAHRPAGPPPAGTQRNPGYTLAALAAVAVLAIVGILVVSSLDGTDDPPEVAEQPTVVAPVAPPGVTFDSGHPDGPALAAVLADWAAGINTADYRRAFDNYTPGLRERVGFENFRDGNSTSQIFDPRLVEVTETGAARVATITFRSTQDPAYGRDGQDCSDWRLRWTMLQGASGAWQVDDVDNTQGSPAPC